MKLLTYLCFVFVGISSSFGQLQFESKRPLPVWSYKCEEQKCIKIPYTKNELTNEYVGLQQCRQFCGKTNKIDFWPMATGHVNSSAANYLEVNYHLIRFRTNNSPGSSKGFWLRNEQRFLKQIRAKHPNGRVNDFISGAKLMIDINVESSNEKLDMDTDETYKLIIGLDRERRFEIVAKIYAETIFGARHALETLAQLIFYDDVSSQLLMSDYVEIEDGPKYKHRGISLDTSRNYYSVKTIKRTIDAMAMVKLNIFHWHLTDSHSFPVVLKSHPYLSKYGAYSSSKTYTARDIKEIVDYAYVRGVRVIPEFDAPAHVGEGWQFTNLTTCFNAQPWDQFCVEPPCGQFDPTKDELYNILEDIYREYVELFGISDLFYMGGDEVSFTCWSNSTELLQWMSDQGWGHESEDFMRLWDYFQRNALQRLDKTVNGKSKIVLWTSTLTEDPYLTKYLDKERYIIQVWTTEYDPQITYLLEQGYKIIISNYDTLYLDCGFGSWVGTGQNWCAPYSGWQQIYENPMVYGEEYKDQIIGSEAVLWSEQAGDETLDGRLWPRSIALAELLWSAPESSYRDAEPRILLQRERFVENGIDAEVLQPLWCVQNEGNCPLYD